MEVVIIGGGAAGFFAAIHCALANTDATVTLVERTSKLLAKVKVSGGGRCNVTHACFQVSEMSKNYPRGEKLMKKALGQFMTTDTVRWFEDRGVPLKAEADGRMFPVSDNSQTVIDCLVHQAQQAGVQIVTNCPVEVIAQTPTGFLLTIKDPKGLHYDQGVLATPPPGPVEQIPCDRLIVASGGSPKASGLDWLKALGHQVVAPVPSLFTFNMPANPITALMGVSVPHVRAKIVGSKWGQEGPLLVTHWGMSGPAILKLSAWGARDIAQVDYRFAVQINWQPHCPEDTLRQNLGQYKANLAQRQIGNRNPLELPARLWDFLLKKVEILPEKRWAELGKNEMNRLINVLTNDVYPVDGKTTYKEEFVTCGGISLDQIDPTTMQSKMCPGLFFAGEVLDVDGITGGFNFQAAWTTGYLAGRAAAK